METTFRTGLNVRCIDATDSILTTNETYKVDAVDQDGHGLNFLFIGGFWWDSTRFEPWTDPPEGMLEAIEDEDDFDDEPLKPCDHKDIESRCKVCGEPVAIVERPELAASYDELAKQRDELLAILRAVGEPMNWTEDGHLFFTVRSMVEWAIEKYKD